jgi:hypothetical protein
MEGATKNNDSEHGETAVGLSWDMESSPLSDPRGEVNTQTADATRPTSRQLHRIGLGLIVFILLGASVGILVFTLKWKKETGDPIAEAPPVTWLIKVAKIQSIKLTGKISIEYQVTEGPSKYLYYVNNQGLNFEELDDGQVDGDDISLILTKLENPTLQDPGESPIVIRSVAKEIFPYLLPDDFLPGDYRALMLLEGSGVADGLLATAKFDFIVDLLQNIGSPTQSPTAAPTGNFTQMPTGTPTLFPSMAVGDESSNSTVVNNDGTITAAPTQLPTINPTTARPSSLPTTLPTFSPSTLPTISPSTAPSIAPSNMPSSSPTTKKNKDNKEIEGGNA